MKLSKYAKRLAKQEAEDKKFQTIKMGTSSKPERVVYDLSDVPQGLRGGERFVTSMDVVFFGKTFPKGSGLTFVHYVLEEHPSSSDEYDNIMYRCAAFIFDNDNLNRTLFADQIERIKE